MFKNHDNDDKINKILNTLGSHKNTKTHDRHLSYKKCKEIGLNVVSMESDDTLQDYSLSIHHSCMDIFETQPTYKIFSNQNQNLLRNYHI